MVAPMLVAFDADDTLWHNERAFRMTQARFAELLADHGPPGALMDRLIAAERRNLGRYGFGVKGFVLSMIETAVDVASDRLPPRVVRELIACGHDMLAHPIDLLPQAAETVAAVAGAGHRVALITKGDLLDQERKLAQSGLGEMFHAVEIVSDKTPAAYRAVFTRLAVPPDGAVMVGNSLRSDVLPVLALGGWGVHVPHDLTWEYEHAEAPTAHPRFRCIPHLGDLPGLLSTL
ncbi:MAG: HAD family hydrolase [Rhodobacteraceae bacterium]|jgi:putative hydrolase of the HAD superfamily|nr:HAD family hydrolase [Paracoccaceae bacterium]